MNAPKTAGQAAYEKWNQGPARLWCNLEERTQRFWEEIAAAAIAFKPPPEPLPEPPVDEVARKILSPYKTLSDRMYFDLKARIEDAIRNERNAAECKDITPEPPPEPTLGEICLQAYDVGKEHAGGVGFSEQCRQGWQAAGEACFRLGAERERREIREAIPALLRAWQHGKTLIEALNEMLDARAKE